MAYHPVSSVTRPTGPEAASVHQPLLINRLVKLRARSVVGGFDASGAIADWSVTTRCLSDPSMTFSSRLPYQLLLQDPNNNSPKSPSPVDHVLPLERAHHIESCAWWTFVDFYLKRHPHHLVTPQIGCYNTDSATVSTRASLRSPRCPTPTSSVGQSTR